MRIKASATQSSVVQSLFIVCTVVAVFFSYNCDLIEQGPQSKLLWFQLCTIHISNRVLTLKLVCAFICSAIKSTTEEYLKVENDTHSHY